MKELQKQSLGGGLQEHTLEDVFSNLDEDKMEEAKLVFLHAVEEGLLVKNCISEVHNKVAWLLVIIRTFSSDKGLTRYWRMCHLGRGVACSSSSSTRANYSLRLV